MTATVVTPRPADPAISLPFRLLAKNLLPDSVVRFGIRRLLADSLREHGADPEQAAQIATLIVAAVEGTVAMCRAKRSTEPLDHIAEQLQAVVRNAISD